MFDRANRHWIEWTDYGHYAQVREPLYKAIKDKSKETVLSLLNVGINELSFLHVLHVVKDLNFRELQRLRVWPASHFEMVTTAWASSKKNRWLSLTPVQLDYTVQHGTGDQLRKSFDYESERE